LWRLPEPSDHISYTLSLSHAQAPRDSSAQKEEKQEEAEEASGRRKVGKMECHGGGAT